ncbi:SPOR domain-containing protein [Legionella sp. CNM-4043-24]|uniref:SPOR domain-containing protein n=1 Tax=Legionella sp. CNM-4043-24 TaxID=3421646 RepID=UPI00403A86E5
MQDDLVEQEARNASKMETLLKPKRWLMAIEIINRLVLSRNLLITVLAEHAGGKTCFRSLLLPGLDKTITGLVIEADSHFTSAQAIRFVAQSLGLTWTRDVTLAELTDAINARKKPVLLIIDEAHFVPYTLLQDFLQELNTRDEPGFFHVCLLSDYSINPRLNSLNEKRFKNLIYCLEPGALTEAETRLYILNSLNAPNQMPVRPPEETLKAFYQETGGNMALINQLKDAFFCGKTLWRHRFVWAMQVRYKRLLSVARRLKVQLPGAWHSIRAFFSSDVKHIFFDSKPDFAFLRKKSFAAGGLAVAALSLTALILNNRPQVTTNTGTQAVQHTDKRAQPLVSRLPEPVRVLKSEIPTFTQASSRSVLRLPSLKMIEEEDDSLEKLVVRDSVLVIPKPMPKDRRTEDAIEKTIVTRTNSKAVRQIAMISPREEAGTHPHFTIQLLASQSQPDIRRFVIREHLNGKVQTRTFRNKGVLWYVLTMGDFNRRDKAQRAIKNLPSKLAALHPWVRAIDVFTAIG